MNNLKVLVHSVKILEWVDLYLETNIESSLCVLEEAGGESRHLNRNYTIIV